MNDASLEKYGDQVLSAGWAAERQRLAAIEAVCDATTVDVLERLGVSAGWHCLEVGAGGGSIAVWLDKRVSGSGGRVVATDIDVRHFAQSASPTLTVIQHDVSKDPLESNSFDLIHARFVLEHLPSRELVLDRFIEWLKPGGWAVIESIASFPIASCANDTFRTAMRAIEDVLALAIGTDAQWARTFPYPLLRRGFSNVDASIRIGTTGGLNASAECWALTLTQLRQRIVESNLAQSEVLDGALRLLADPEFFEFSFATAIGWGQKV